MLRSMLLLMVSFGVTVLVVTAATFGMPPWVEVAARFPALMIRAFLSI